MATGAAKTRSSGSLAARAFVHARQGLVRFRQTPQSVLALGARLVLALVLVLPAVPPAAAQGFNLFGWFEQTFPGQRSHSHWRNSHRRSHYQRAITRPKPVPKKPAVPPTFFIAVLGDSLGEMLDFGLSDALSDHPEIGVLDETHASSGLVRNDFYDWAKAVKTLLASGQKINVAIMMIGSNDHQPIRQDGNTYAPGSPQWTQIYGQRIETIAAMFHAAKIPLLWVGLPIMRSERYSSEMAALNDLYRDHAAKAGATFIDVWDAFGDNNGQYNADGPDVNGQTVRLRTSDGIHFTKAGERKLAQFVQTDVLRILNASEPTNNAALATIETTTPSGTSSPSGAKPVLVKPPIGPVLPLTGPVLAPGAQLATMSSVAKQKGKAQKLINETFVTGRAPKPKPGRADDFSWPLH